MKDMKKKEQSTVVRLFSQLKGQKVRLTVVALSIVIYVGLSIWNPMYSARVIDHLWQNIQDAWNNGTQFALSWTNMGRELTQLSVQYFFTWIFYYLQSYLMANVAESLNLAQEAESLVAFSVKLAAVRPPYIVAEVEFAVSRMTAKNISLPHAPEHLLT